MLARRLLIALPLLLPFALLAQASLETPAERPRFKSPLGLAVDPTGQFAYVALQSADALAIVDLHKNQVLCEIPVGKQPHDVALHKGVAYVTCEADDTLVAVDVAARKIKRIFKVGQAPRGVSVDPSTGAIQVVCHDAKVLWTRHGPYKYRNEPIPPQPEGNYARAGNLHLAVNAAPATGMANAGTAAYRPGARPMNLFTTGQSIFDSLPKPAPAPLIAVGGKQPALTMGPPPERTAFNPTLDFDYSRTSMDLVAHTRPRWFTPTASAAEGRVFTNAFSFFVNGFTSAAIVLLDEPAKGYPDPTAVVVKLPKPDAGKPAPAKLGGNADTHPLKGAKVFISSGGADTVVVLDLHKAAKFAETNQPQMMGGFGGMQMGMSGGGMMSGMWGGTFSGGYGGSMNGFGMQGNMMGGINGLQPGIPAGGANPPGGMPGALVPTPALGGTGTPIPASGMMMGGMSGGQMMGWQGGSFLREDLRASSQYTLARLPTQANPRRMVLTSDGKTLVVSNHLADSLTLIDADKLKVVRHIDLGGPTPDEARRGEILFHSAKLTLQQQFTCASCHPNNGADGLSWNTSPDGKGEPLNTRALHGVRDTSPFGWKGDTESFEERAKNTMREVHKHKLSDADASAIAAYVRTIDPPRPLPQKEKDLPAIERGKALFFGKGNCRSCHRGAAYTSASPRAVILDQQQKLTPFDVPSLRGVGRTAPYLHDGRAATLEEIFEKHNPQKRHGLAHELTRPELGDLVAFLKSL